MADETMKPLTVQECTSRAGIARSRKLSPERRREIARAAAEARWGKKHNAGPDGGPPNGGGGSDDRRIVATLAGPTADIM